MIEPLETSDDGENIIKFRQICQQNRSQVFALNSPSRTFNITVQPFTAKLVINLYDNLCDSGKNDFNSLSFISMIKLAIERFQKQKSTR